MSGDTIIINTPAPLITQVTQQQTSGVEVKSPGLQGAPGLSASPNALILPISFFVDAGEQIRTGLKTWFRVPLSCTIIDWELVADQQGSIVFDIWKSTFANLNIPTYPTAAQSICGSAKPTISNAKKASGLPTGWTTAINAGEYLFFNVDSCLNIQRVSLAIKATKDPSI